MRRVLNSFVARVLATKMRKSVPAWNSSTGGENSSWHHYTSSSSSSSTVRVVIFSDCRLPCVKTAMPDKTGKIPQIPG